MSDEKSEPKCTWINVVKTSRAKGHLRVQCHLRMREIEKKSAINILSTIFYKKKDMVEKFISENGLDSVINRASKELSYLEEIKNRIKNSLGKESGFFVKIGLGSAQNSLKLKEQKFNNLTIYSNHSIYEAIFDYCCHPKFNDEIVAIKDGSKVYVHHKLCDRAMKSVDEDANMVFVRWVINKNERYKVIVALEDRIGTLANFLSTLAKYGCNVVGVSYSGYESQFFTHCEILFETDSENIKELKKLVTKKYKIIEFTNQKDAYLE